MSEWQYQNKPLNENEIPVDAMGFIYMITQLSTGKKYIGKKLLTAASTKTVKGVKKKIRKPSDWKEYWSSSPDLKKLIEQVGQQDFVREILVFVTSKGSLAAAEEMALYSVGALESDMWFNNNIRSRIYRSWIKKHEMEELRHQLKTLQIYK